MGKSLEIYLLGGIDIHCDGEPVSRLASRKAEALLAYLVCNPRSHAREVLATLFWDDRTQKQALGNLRVVLNSLRQNLGEFIEITRQTVTFKSDSEYWLDIAAFEACTAGWQKEGMARARISPKEAALLEEAISYYRGDFLEGFYLRESQGFEEWAILQRERLQRQVLDALQDLASYRLRRRDYAAGIKKAARLVELDPLREEGHRVLMRLLARNGRRNAALRQYQTCAQILADELGVEPTFETEQLFARLKAVRRVKAHHLPLELSQFVGRQEDLADISECFENPACRLVTLLGPGGIGKTWLAAEYAHLAAEERADAYPDGVYFVSLAAVESEFLVLSIAAALLFSFFGRSAPQEQLVNYLRNKEILLVLDNFEHLLNADHTAVELLVELLRQAPGLHFLVTSRQALHLRAEWLLEIQGLQYPQETVNNPGTWSAVQLFEIASRRVQPDFLITRELPEVVRICQLVEGMPLGIELAASWLRGYTCAEIAQQIADSLDFLSTSLQDLPPRHRSLRATFEHSWHLLSPQEQDVFCRLSIFRGGFSGEAAHEIANANREILLSLTEKSLVQRDPAGRYSVHELLRQYAEEKLATALQVWQETCTRHTEYYLNFLYARREKLHGEEQFQTIQQIIIEIDNLRISWNWALDHQLIDNIERVMEALHRFYDIRSWLQEGYDRFTKAVKIFEALSNTDEIDPDKLQLCLGRTMTYQGWYAYRLGNLSEAQTILQASEKILRAADDTANLAFALNALGHVVKDNLWREQFYRESLALHQQNGSVFGALATLNGLAVVLRGLGRYAEAEQILEEAIQICHQIDDQWTLSIVRNNQGVTARVQGDYRKAQACYQESCTIKENIGDQRGHAISLNNLGNVEYELGAYAEAEKLHQQSLSICQELGDQTGVARSYNNLGKLAHIQGDYAKAWDFHQQSLKIKEEIDDRWGKAHSLNQLGITALALGQIETACGFFRQALDLAVTFNSVPLTLSVLVGVGQSRQHSQQTAEAIRILACALSHEATEKSARERGTQILEALRKQVSPEDFAALWEKGCACSLENTVARILELPQDEH